MILSRVSSTGAYVADKKISHETNIERRIDYHTCDTDDLFHKAALGASVTLGQVLVIFRKAL